MTSNTAQTETASAPAEKNKPHKKASTGARGANVASPRAKTGKKASRSKRAPKGRTKATGARDGSKTAKILDLLKRPGGATAKDLQKASGWQPHSMRGFLSGMIRKKMGLTLASTKAEHGERSYAVKP